VSCHGVNDPVKSGFGGEPCNIPYQQFLDGYGLFMVGGVTLVQWVEDCVNAWSCLSSMACC